MNTTLAKWMTLIIAANIMFVPLLSYIDSLHREAVEVVLQEGAKKAAIEGRFTTEIINDMKQELVDHYNFDESKIQITATQALTRRNEYIEGKVVVPRGPIWIFEIFNRGPNTIEKNTKVLSEYLD
ncbi:hypothetical protein ACFFIX_20580 [Metabacillus herbersteinensis]|uniref:DUF4320 family protein n=1 Tax=Metabacillus herbersteinensis TaxID=283816 RepID=A0ABV6GJA9_9BACI